MLEFNALCRQHACRAFSMGLLASARMTKRRRLTISPAAEDPCYITKYYHTLTGNFSNFNFIPILHSHFTPSRLLNYADLMMLSGGIPSPPPRPRAYSFAYDYDDAPEAIEQDNDVEMTTPPPPPPLPPSKPPKKRMSWLKRRRVSQP